jgi:HD-GYP domain-containing protein (c-di-GMP phosphodiesterase class II)
MTWKIETSTIKKNLALNLEEKKIKLHKIKGRNFLKNLETPSVLIF